MEHSISKMPRPVRRRLKKIAQQSRSAIHSRRATALLLRYEKWSYSEIGRQLQASRTSIKRWESLYLQFGEAGLVPERGGRPPETVNGLVCSKLLELIEEQPSRYGYARSRWTSEMLAEQIREQLKQFIHASTVRRLLPKLGVNWRRARPTLLIQDPQKSCKMKKIKHTLENCSSQEPVFYVDEVDVDLNPRIGNCWSLRGQQATIPTPGKNVKRYLCGALHATTGRVLWVEWERKTTDIFLLMMAELRRQYRRAKTINLILDNYRIHKSHKVALFLKQNPKFRLYFQPAYHPWVNKIELLWKKLHDTVTRNHRYSTINQLMNAVNEFMTNASNKFGVQLALAKVG